MEEREYSEEDMKNNPRFKHHKNIEQVINMQKMKPFDLEAGKPVCTRDGICDEHDNNLNLMMSSEKKEGWIIIYKEAIYDKETAEKIARETTANVIRIQKIEWEE